MTRIYHSVILNANWNNPYINWSFTFPRFNHICEWDDLVSTVNSEMWPYRAGNSWFGVSDKVWTITTLNQKFYVSCGVIPGILSVRPCNILFDFSIQGILNYIYLTDKNHSALRLIDSLPRFLNLFSSIISINTSVMSTL